MSCDTGHWILSEDITSIEDPYGFIYLITCKETGRMYIGKKQILSKRKMSPLKGKTRKRTKIVETDWKTYTSSSRELNDDIIKYGKDSFTFQILRFCTSKWELAYFEAEEQFKRGVLLSEMYYNGIINLRIGKNVHKGIQPSNI